MSLFLYRIKCSVFCCESYGSTLVSRKYNFVLKYVHTDSKNKSSKSQGSYRSKEKIIQQLNFKCDEDAVPFYKLTIRNLWNIYKVTKQDENVGFCKNRLYYIADRIQCPPADLRNSLAKRIFVYCLTPDWLQNSLNVLVDMGVAGDRICRDLWVLKYHHETIRHRLQMVKDTGRQNLYPWMVRCPLNTLDRSIKRCQDAKDILGDDTSTLEYLAQRLNTTPDVIDDMCLKVPYLRYIRVTKVKSFLDYLFSEGFKADEIIHKPRILAASQSTVTERLNILKCSGVKSINLNIVCRSKKDFEKFCKTAVSVSKFKDI